MSPRPKFTLPSDWAFLAGYVVLALILSLFIHLKTSGQIAGIHTQIPSSTP